MIGPQASTWFAVFSFSEDGYVKDDEAIDAAELLASLKESDTASNEERARLGMTKLYTDGWQVAPHYDSATNRLEWGVRLRSEDGEQIINYTSRLLGRSGVMSAVLVADPTRLAVDTADFKSVLEGFTYLPGQTYAEYREGDKVAEYGLAALVLGGAAAVATKKGFWGIIAGFLAAFWKVLAAAAVAAVAGIGKLFGRRKTSE